MLKPVTGSNAGVTAPQGFLAGATYAGIKKAGKGHLDLALLTSENSCQVAGVFTTNRVKAAPVLVSMERVQRGQARAVVVNSGCANACVGAAGLTDAYEMARLAAVSLHLDPEEVLVGSTGIIGVRLPLDRIATALGGIQVARGGGHAFARAIMTTDLVSKEAAVQLEVQGKLVTVGGAAKGSGMIHPNLATMLAYLTTDAAVEPGFLHQVLAEAVADTFNMVSVDGDTSTNDTVLLLANGAAGTGPLTADSPDAPRFAAAVTWVARSLARAIARDGEGAGHLIEVTVAGATTRDDARRAARAVAVSNLVKAAVTGHDPNWGRILAAVGYSGAEVDPDRVAIALGDLQIVHDGCALPFSRADASAALTGDEVFIRVDLNLGEATATAWGCDLTEEYVRINSEYST